MIPTLTKENLALKDSLNDAVQIGTVEITALEKQLTKMIDLELQELGAGLAENKVATVKVTEENEGQTCELEADLQTITENHGVRDSGRQVEAAGAQFDSDEQTTGGTGIRDHDDEGGWGIGRSETEGKDYLIGSKGSKEWLGSCPLGHQNALPDTLKAIADPICESIKDMQESNKLLARGYRKTNSPGGGGPSAMEYLVALFFEQNIGLVFITPSQSRDTSSSCDLSPPRRMVMPRTVHNVFGGLQGLRPKTRKQCRYAQHL